MKKFIFYPWTKKMPISWTYLIPNFLKSPGLKLWMCKLKLINDINIKTLWNVTATKISLATLPIVLPYFLGATASQCIEQPIKLLQNASTGSINKNWEKTRFFFWVFYNVCLNPIMFYDNSQAEIPFSSCHLFPHFYCTVESKLWWKKW